MESHDYYARINGKDYPIAWGFSIMEELGETLDSGNITIPHIFEIIPLKPYDDVIIHDYAPNVSPSEGGLPNRPLGKVFHPEEGHFYKHMVVSSYTREKVNLADEKSKVDGDGKKYFSRAYNYAIQLKSETSKLETVQMPNKTITQPMSVSEDGDSVSLAANFEFGSMKRTLPYVMSDTPRNSALRLVEVTREIQEAGSVVRTEHYILNAYIGDDEPGSADYSSFLPMNALASEGAMVVLPDWAVSGVTTVHETYDTYITGIIYRDKWDAPIIHHPAKHWIIRKLNGKSTAGWENRDTILTRIKKYLAGGEDGEIVNSSVSINGVSGVRDITSSDQMAAKSAVFPSGSASYIIYLYCDPEIVEYQGKKFNIYGMTDNANGTTIPTANDEFLCSWGTESSPFSVGSSAALSKGALSAFEAMRQAIELYSPYVKAKESASSDVWVYRRKFSLGDDVRALFSSVIAPENQWNYPNLRDYLTRIMYVKDCIPVVHDGVINCMNLSKRGIVPFDDSKGLFGIESYAMDGNSYCDRLIRTYNDGLSKDNVVKCVERIGFKNSDSATLTIDNLRLEFAHPIYRITKILMCHYNRMKAGDADYAGVIKQDITPLVILNSQRNLLLEDWASLENALPNSLSELAKYKFATIGYDVGSRYISGWGAKYTYPSCVFWSGSKTVIENIYAFANKLNPYGSSSFSIYSALQKIAGAGAVNASSEEFPSGADSTRNALKSASSSGTEENEKDYSAETSEELVSVSLNATNSWGNSFSNYTLKLKSLFFIVEYEGYVSASVMASKDFHDGDVVSRDNASSSLSFVESDGANQKEKVNRLGNAIITQPVRYSNRDDIEELTQVWDGYSLSDEESESEGSIDLSDRAKEHDDEVLYQRRMTFEKDFVQVAYTFCRNYVLRNYFTSVFAKRRPFALASYEESVERQENKTIQLLFSPDSARYQSYSTAANYDLGNLVETILSFYERTKYDEDGNKIIANGVDFSYYMVFPSFDFSYDGQCGVFATDCQKFTSGNSLCFSVAMTDNVSAGVFVSDWNPTLGSYLGNLMQAKLGSSIKLWKNGFNLTEEEVKASDLVTGSKQSWFMFPVDPDTGELYSMRFGVGMKRNDFYAVDSPKELADFDMVSQQMLPLSDSIVFSPDLSEVTYFGFFTLTTNTLQGLGYPRLGFYRNSELYSGNSLAFETDFESVNESHKYSHLVYHKASADYLGGKISFLSHDLDFLSRDRQEIREFISARFLGKETESSSETDTCVFKDGKERLSVTLQVEPISEDNRILFSDRMMKLSDAIGGYDKNYESKTVGNKIKISVGITNRQFYYFTQTSISGGVSKEEYAVSASIPSATIFIPENALPAIGKATLDVNMTYAWSGNASYSITIKKIKGIDTAGRLIASCSISCSASSSEFDEDVAFFKNDPYSQYVYGRTGRSKFNKDYVLFSDISQSGYIAFSMVDDGFIISEYGYVYFNDESQDLETSPGIGGTLSDAGSSSLARVNLNSSKFLDYPLSKGTGSYGTNTDAAYMRVISTETSSLIYKNYSLSRTIEDPHDVAEIDASEIKKLAKTHNMFWVLAPIMASREASFDVRGSINEGDMDVLEISGGYGDSYETYWTKEYTLTQKKLTTYLRLLNISDAKDILLSHYPDDYWENQKVDAVILGSWDKREGEGKVSDLALTLNTNGTFNLTGSSGTAIPLKEITRTIRAQITAHMSATRKYNYPISVENDGRGLHRLKITLPTPLTGERSLRLYHKEGAEYHFVFGANLGAKADEGKSADVIYPSDDAGKTYYIYVSVLDDRSKTVIDAITGDPTYKVVNWLDDERKGKTPYNACVKKG